MAGALRLRRRRINGIYVVNAADPKNPTLVKQVFTKDLGMYKVSQVYPIGNVLVASQVLSGENRPFAALLDISNPEQPRPMATLKGIDNYSSFVNGGRIYIAGLGGRLGVYDISDLAGARLLGIQEGLCKRNCTDVSHYLSVQDDFAHVGNADDYIKVDLSGLRSGGAMKEAGSVNLEPHSAGFTTVFGNLTFVGDDHWLAALWWRIKPLPTRPAPR